MVNQLLLWVFKRFLLMLQKSKNTKMVANIVRKYLNSIIIQFKFLYNSCDITGEKSGGN